MHIFSNSTWKLGAFALTFILGVLLARPSHQQTQTFQLEPPTPAVVLSEKTPVTHFRDIYTKPFFENEEEIKNLILDPLQAKFKKRKLKIIRLDTGAGPFNRTFYDNEEIKGCRIQVEIEGPLTDGIETLKTLETSQKVIVMESTSYRATGRGRGNTLIIGFAPIG